MKFRKRPIVIEAVQWWKNGDHPLDYTDNHISGMSAEYRRRENWEGELVHYFRHPSKAYAGERHCEQCGQIMHKHGWMDTLEGQHVVCPGDWIITGVKGEHYPPCKPDIFEATYECVEDMTTADIQPKTDGESIAQAEARASREERNRIVAMVIRKIDEKIDEWADNRRMVDVYDEGRLDAWSWMINELDPEYYERLKREKEDEPRVTGMG
jgi:hypothetical protein